MIFEKRQAKSRAGAFRGWLNVSLLLHILWATLFIWVIWFGPFDQILPRPEWVNSCALCQHSADAISTASQMGRLDIVSIALTVLGVTLAVAALGSYNLIKGAAKDAAANEAIEWLQLNHNKLTPDILKILMDDQRFILTLVTEMQKRIFSNTDDVTAKNADAIAQSMEEPK